MIMKGAFSDVELGWLYGIRGTLSFGYYRASPACTLILRSILFDTICCGDPRNGPQTFP